MLLVIAKEKGGPSGKIRLTGEIGFGDSHWRNTRSGILLSRVSMLYGLQSNGRDSDTIRYGSLRILGRPFQMNILIFFLILLLWWEMEKTYTFRKKFGWLNPLYGISFQDFIDCLPLIKYLSKLE